MPFHNFGGDASESGDDDASRALPVHGGAAAGSLFGGGERAEPETVAAYDTAPVPESGSKPNVLDEGCDAKPVAVCVDTESDGDVWHKRTAAQRRAVKTRKPTAEQQMTKAVAELTSSMLARAACALGIGHPGGVGSEGSGGVVGAEGSGGSGVTGLSGVGSEGSGGVQGDQKKEKQKRQSGHSGGSGGAAEEEGKKTRAPRGSAGTFGGRRPPKDPSKLALFEARRAAHLKAKEDAKDGAGKCPSLRQAQYWKHLSENLKAGNGMKAQTMKRPAAAVDEATSPTTKKNKPKDNKKDDQDDDEPPEKTDEKASGSAQKVNEQPKQ